MPLNFNTLLDELNKRIDKPIDYNRLLAEYLTVTYDLVQVDIVDGMPVFFDTFRGKNLSLARPVFQASAHGLAIQNRYLSVGDVPTQMLQGVFMPRDATITGLWAKSRSAGTWVLEIRKNGLPLTLASIVISSGSGFDSNMDVDLNAGDTLQFFANGTNISHIIAGVELAWRTSAEPTVF